MYIDLREYQKNTKTQKLANVTWSRGKFLMLNMKFNFENGSFLKIKTISNVNQVRIMFANVQKRFI